MVVMATSPFAAEIRVGRTISGMALYLAGPNSALCEPIRNSTLNMATMLPDKIANTPTIISRTSATLHQTITFRLLNRSAK